MVGAFRRWWSTVAHEVGGEEGEEEEEEGRRAVEKEWARTREERF